MTNPLISVIIPVYNPGKYLLRCLDSVINQTYRNLQIILVDDGSTDGSGEICERYAAADDRIICIHQENKGVSAARNRGIELAIGDYYHFPDSDDFLELDTYEYSLNLLFKHRCDAINFEYYVTYPDREEAHRMTDWCYGLFDVKDTHRLLIMGEPFAWNKLFSKKLVTGESVDWNNDLSRYPITFREDIYRGEDSLFAHTALDRVTSVWFDKRPLYHYVQSEESACRGTFKPSQLSVLKLYEAYEPLYKDKYPDLWLMFIANMADTLIMIFYDMWSDQMDYTKEQQVVVEAYRRHYWRKMLIHRLTFKRRVKYDLFSISPTTFCRVHKIVHGL